MTIQLEERITNHDTYKRIEINIELLNTIISSEDSSEVIQQLERIYETLNILKKAIDRVDPWLLSPNTLKNMNGHIINISNELKNFNSNKNNQHLKNANMQLDNVIPFISQVMVTRTPEDIEGVRESVISFRKSVGQHLGNLEKQVNATTKAFGTNKEKLNDLTVAIENQKKRVDSVITGFQEQFLKGQTDRNEEAKKLIQSIDGNISEKMKNNGKEMEIQQTNYKESFEALMEKIKSEMDKEYENINKMNEEAEKIVGIISMKGLASGYQKIANEEGRKAFWWNIGSIASILAVITFGVFFILFHEGTMEWTTLISRIVLSGLGLTLFTYCAKQAGSYRSEERRNRKIELELASLDPYLKDLEEPEQKRVKENLVTKYFGVELPNANGQKHSTQKMVDTLVDNPQFVQLFAEKVSKEMSKIK